MLFTLKKLFFKFMELGLGLKPFFKLETRDPIFINFRLTEDEAGGVRSHLPAGYELQKIRFASGDSEPAYWVSYNLYEILYPKEELSKIKKVRCEINTFVKDPSGKRGVYVFSGSPYVSAEKTFSPIGMVCDFAERLVMLIYGVGKLIPLEYRLEKDRFRVQMREGANEIQVAHELSVPAQDRLSDEYWIYNDISFFNEAKTRDYVYVGSDFFGARFDVIDGPGLQQSRIKGPFFDRSPDRVYVHRGQISYLVSAMNQVESSDWVRA